MNKIFYQMAIIIGITTLTQAAENDDILNKGEKFQEDQVYEMIVSRGGIGDMFTTHHDNFGHDFGEMRIPDQRFKLPKNSTELREWCAKGDKIDLYQNAIRPKRSYALQLFYAGILDGKLPFVKYVIENHNNFWNRTTLNSELAFPLGQARFSITAYLIQKNSISILDYVIKNESFRHFVFETTFKKNQLKNTPFHTLAKYGTKEMTERLLQEKELVALCFNAENIKGENNQTPAELAKDNNPDEEVFLLLNAAVNQHQK